MTRDEYDGIVYPLIAMLAGPSIFDDLPDGWSDDDEADDDEGE